MKAIDLTKKDFNIKGFRSFYYNDFEIQILMNIALCLHRIGKDEEYFEILKFCKKKVDKSDELYSRISVNLGNAYSRDQRYKEALNVYESAIEYSRKYNNFERLDLLYYGKGVCQYKLGLEEYRESFTRAMNFCKVTGRDNLFSQIKKELKGEI